MEVVERIFKLQAKMKAIEGYETESADDDCSLDESDEWQRESNKAFRQGFETGRLWAGAVVPPGQLARRVPIGHPDFERGFRAAVRVAIKRFEGDRGDEG